MRDVAAIVGKITDDPETRQNAPVVTDPPPAQTPIEIRPEAIGSVSDVVSDVDSSPVPVMVIKQVMLLPYLKYLALYATPVPVNDVATGVQVVVSIDGLVIIPSAIVIESVDAFNTGSIEWFGPTTQLKALDVSETSAVVLNPKLPDTSTP